MIEREATGTRLLRFAAPALVALAALAAWQGLVVAYDIPPYLVPSPAAVLATLVADRALLLDSLGVTLGIALTALAIAVAAGRPCRALVRAEPLDRDEPVSVRGAAAGDADRRDRAADHHLGEGHANRARHLCASSSRSSRSSPTRRWACAAWIRACSISSACVGRAAGQVLWRLRVPSALPYFFGGLRISSGLALIGAVVAEFVAGTGGQGAGLAYQILLAGHPAQHPAAVRGARADRGGGRRAVRGDRVAVARGALALARKRARHARLARRFRRQIRKASSVSDANNASGASRRFDSRCAWW